MPSSPANYALGLFASGVNTAEACWAMFPDQTQQTAPTGFGQEVRSIEIMAASAVAGGSQLLLLVPENGQNPVGNGPIGAQWMNGQNLFRTVSLTTFDTSMSVQPGYDPGKAFKIGFLGPNIGDKILWTFEPNQLVIKNDGGVFAEQTLVLVNNGGGVTADMVINVEFFGT